MSIKFKIAVAGMTLVAVLAGGWFLSNRGNDGIQDQPRELSRTELELREGTLYAKGESKTFNGTLAEQFPAKTKRISIEIREGKPDGLSRGWYENGQIEVEEHFVDGVSHGVRTRWFANGVKKSEAQIVHGVIEGTFTRWHDNGRKAAVVIMVNGVPHGISKAWYASGKLKSRVIMKTGEIVEREFFDDSGKQRSHTTSS